MSEYNVLDLTFGCRLSWYGGIAARQNPFWIPGRKLERAIVPDFLNQMI